MSDYDQKGERYVLTESIDTRVVIDVGINILGYHGFWKSIYTGFGITLDGDLDRSLKGRDLRKRA